MLLTTKPYLPGKLAAAELRTAIYSGDIWQLQALPELDEFIARCREFVYARCAPYQPERIHERIAPEAYPDWTSATQAAFRDDAKLLASFQALLTEAALNLGAAQDLYFDSLELRIAAPIASHSRARRSHVGLHRDTWGVGIDQQINLWAPLFRLARNRTMGFYPHYWNRPLANTSGTWSFKGYNEAARNAPPGVAPDYPSAPEASAQPSGALVPVLIKPGSMLVFSSTHLHSSIANRSQLTRFSFEARVVNKCDLISGHAAPNPDCQSQPPLYKLFRQLSDGSRSLAPA